MMKKTFICLAMFLLTSVQFAFAQSEMDKAIKELLEVTQSKERFIDGIKMMSENMKQNEAFSVLPEAFWEDFLKESEASYPVLEAKIIEVYKKIYTLEEIKLAIDIYKTPTGKSYMDKSQTATAEIMKFAMEWGQELGKKLAKKLADDK